MKIKTFAIISAVLVLIGCSGKQTTNESISDDQSNPIEIPNNTIITRYKVPEGWRRVETKKGSFEEYLQNLPLKPEGYVTHLYNGEEKQNKVATAVVDMDIDSVDLQQCADAIIRLRAEYLYSKGLYDQIHFNFTNGFRCDYSKWAEGYRIKTTGNHTEWIKTDSTDYSYPTFRQYLLKVFEYAGTASLYNELEMVTDPEDFGIGTIIINPGFPGHAVIVVDMIENINHPRSPYGRAVMLAQSYMPAQEIEILQGTGEGVDLGAEDKKYWTMEEVGDKPINRNGGCLHTPEYNFYNKKLKKFKENE